MLDSSNKGIVTVLWPFQTFSVYAILGNNKLILVIINNYMVRDMSISTNRSLTKFDIHAYIDIQKIEDMLIKRNSIALFSALSF